MGETGSAVDAHGQMERCNTPVTLDDLEGRVCYDGIDLSSPTDITAFVLVFLPENLADETELYIIAPWFWIPEDNLELRVARDHVPYDLWQRQGFHETTEGNVVHYPPSNNTSNSYPSG